MQNLPVKPETTEEKPARVTPLWRTIFNQIIIFFTIGCVFGTYWEEIMHIVKQLWSTGTFEWVSRRGLLYGPFSPVYGIGAVLIYLIFCRSKMSPVSCFFWGAIFGGTLEYMLSVIQENIFGTISWDYSDRMLNIAGRTTIPYMVAWGLLVLIFVEYIYPFVDRLYQRVHPKTINVTCAILAVFLAFDIAISLFATMRQTLRHEGDPADTRLEVFLDTYYDDERIYKTYTNLREVEE